MKLSNVPLFGFLESFITDTEMRVLCVKGAEKMSCAVGLCIDVAEGEGRRAAWITILPAG